MTRRDWDEEKGRKREEKREEEIESVVRMGRNERVVEGEGKVNDGED